MNIKQSLIENDLFILNMYSDDFESLIKKGVSLLAKKDLVEEDQYYNAIIRSYKEFGPYFVICPEVVMPHARPEEGAKGTGFSLITLKEPITIPDIADPISVIITLVAKDKDEHLSIGMAEVAQLFGDPSNVEKIKKAQNKADLECVLNEVFA